ncbi:MAG: hypothetical protein ACREFP_23010 [Acetobacteraceae bacterium]
MRRLKDGWHLLEDGGQCDADGTAQGVDGRTGRGTQQGVPAVLLDLDFAEVGEIVDDALPLDIAAAARRSKSSLRSRTARYVQNT